jgi:hypothetical protein
MTILTGLFIVAAASSIALFVNDRFHLGGYIDEQELAPLPAPKADAVEEKELVAV